MLGELVGWVFGIVASALFPSREKGQGPTKRQIARQTAQLRSGRTVRVFGRIDNVLPATPLAEDYLFLNVLTGMASSIDPTGVYRRRRAGWPVDNECTRTDFVQPGLVIYFGAEQTSVSFRSANGLEVITCERVNAEMVLYLLAGLGCYEEGTSLARA